MIKKILMGKDGFPVELVEGKPILNFLRKLIHGRYYECRDCYYEKDIEMSQNKLKELKSKLGKI